MLQEDTSEDLGRSRGYPYKPVLIGDLRAKGHVLEVHCNTCANFVELDPKKLPLDDRLPVPEARSYFKCSRCGSRSIRTRPQVYKETNAQIRQAARKRNVLPWNATRLAPLKQFPPITVRGTPGSPS